ncbi:calycin-like domain-containing protein [[Clostridium] sordellii]|uniref:DUF1934 domain-containing protein n=1 Tax=Paraclostridium sordellii TaxID=1505 RepID=UPI0005E09212|nr:DUF1934 domain-containing protein [Paeniclostridium sordellii]MDU4415010.1 DUF1934 domain-containing protein [Paeniclostridium sordellii]MRZ27557.1 DUF1934 family protein [Paeniclostridium sordellii]MVO74019.1 DUF1934 family protein [Paeniclostridium sordellii]CEO37037.1 calycin-like domain-containing protein [[Clostridium] sordellii] [Paeniclostridium sordellii]CEP95194.1 calycin-like domain-containing protein [[Clostridium] sordellii] [Paeniclostridium sordellii]
MIDVNISMITKQYDNLGNEDIIEVLSNGKLYEKNDGIYVIYKEELEKKSAHVTTTIKISEKEILIKRFGLVNSNMKFILDKETTTLYKTPQGIFNIKINTNKLDIKETDKDIEIEIDYNMEILGLFKGVNIIKIKIEKYK